MLDVLVIGGGPAGLTAAIYAKRAGLTVEVYEKNIYGAGQIAESERVDNYPGLWGLSGYDLAQKFVEHSGEMGIEALEGEAAGIYRVPAEGATAFRTVFADGTDVLSETVIYAAGASHRKLGCAGEAEFAGRGVSYCATCDGAFFAGREVAVVGGGNAALDDALYLSGICSRVYLIHRRNEFRGFGGTVERIRRRENIQIVTPHRVAVITGNTKVEAVELEDGTRLAVAGVFIAAGMKPETDVLQQATADAGAGAAGPGTEGSKTDGSGAEPEAAAQPPAVALDETGYIIADETGATGVPGFFAAGDVRTKALRQVVTAAADGANAAMSAAAYIENLRG